METETEEGDENREQRTERPPKIDIMLNLIFHTPNKTIFYVV